MTNHPGFTWAERFHRFKMGLSWANPGWWMVPLLVPHLFIWTAMFSCSSCPWLGLLLLFTIYVFFFCINKWYISEECMGEVDRRVGNSYPSVFHWGYSHLLHLLTHFPLRRQSPAVPTPKPPAALLSHAVNLISLSFSSCTLNQHLILSSNKMKFCRLNFLSERKWFSSFQCSENSEALRIRETFLFN